MLNTVSTVHCQDWILAQKLSKLGRPSYLKHFQELRDDKIITLGLEEAVRYLHEDTYSLENRILAVYLVSIVLWPYGHWCGRRPRPREWREFFLRGPDSDPKNAARRCLILVNEADKNTSPISTATLIGQQGRLEFDLREPSKLYQLFEAALDSEMVYEYQLRSIPVALPTMEMVQANVQRQHQRLEEYERRFASLIDAERAWLRKQNYQVQLRGWIGFLESHRPKSQRSATKPLHTSDLQYGLLSTMPAPFYFYTRRIEIPAHLCGPRQRATIILDRTPGCESDRIALRQMMTQAMEFLQQKNDMLSKELCALRAKMCDLPTSTEEQSRGVIASAVTSIVPKDWGPNTRDEVHIICRSEVDDSTEIWVLDAGWCGWKKWVVKIQRKRSNHLAAVHARVGDKRKADETVEEGDT